LLYVCSAEQKHLAVKEIPTGRHRPSLNLQIGDTSSLRLCHVHPRSRIIIAMARETTSSDHHIIGLEPLSGTVVSDVPIGYTDRAHFLSHPDENLVFASFGRRHILILDGSTLQPLDSVDVGMFTAGIALDSIHQLIYIAEAAPRDGVTHVKTLSTFSFQITRSFEYTSRFALDRVAVDPERQRFALIGERAIRVYDPFGALLWDVPVSVQIGDFALSERSKHLLFLDPLGTSRLSRPGRLATMYRINLSTLAFDSSVAGIDANRIFIYQPTNESVSINPGSSSIDVAFVPDGSRRLRLLLGHSVEDIALPDSDHSVLVTNATGSGTSFSQLDLKTNRLRPINADLLSMRFAGREEGQPIILGSNSSVDFSILNSDDGTQIDHLSLQTAPAIKGYALPSFDTDHSGLLLAFYPEWEYFLLINLATRSVIRTAAIEGYSYRPEDEAGAVQACFTRNGEMIAILNARSQIIDVYSPISAGLKKRLSLHTLDWTRLLPFKQHRLKGGTRNNTVWYGPYQIDLAREAVDSIPFSGQLEFIGEGPNGRFLAIGYDTSGVSLLAASNERFSNFTTHPLEGTPNQPDAVCMHKGRGLLALGYSEEGMLRLYRLSSLADAYETPPSAMHPSVVSLYPTFLPAYEQSCITISVMPWESLGVERTFEIWISDFLGRVRCTRRLNVSWKQGGSFTFDVPPLSPGSYFCITRNTRKQFTFPLQVGYRSVGRF
jgi:hypothetical protein